MADEAVEPDKSGAPVEEAPKELKHVDADVAATGVSDDTPKKVADAKADDELEIKGVRDDAKVNDESLKDKLEKQVLALRKDAGDDAETAKAFLDKVKEDAGDTAEALEAEARRLMADRAADGKVSKVELDFREDREGHPVDNSKPAHELGKEALKSDDDGDVNADRKHRLPLLTPEEAADRRNLK